MVSVVFGSRVENCSFRDFHYVVICISDANAEALVVNVGLVAGGFIEGSNVLSGYILWAEF